MLTKYDELFCHQMVSTFDRPGTSAREWTERAWIQIHHIEGTAEHPDATLTVSSGDWAAIRRGEMSPFNAWTSGRLNIAGDHVLFQQLADRIVEAWD